MLTVISVDGDGCLQSYQTIRYKLNISVYIAFLTLVTDTVLLYIYLEVLYKHIRLLCLCHLNWQLSE